MKAFLYGNVSGMIILTGLFIYLYEPPPAMSDSEKVEAIQITLDGTYVPSVPRYSPIQYVMIEDIPIPTHKPKYYSENERTELTQLIERLL